MCMYIDSFPELVSNAVWIPFKQRYMGPVELVSVYLLQFTVCCDFLVYFTPDGCMVLGSLPLSVNVNPLKWTQVITCFNQKENSDGSPDVPSSCPLHHHPGTRSLDCPGGSLLSMTFRSFSKRGSVNRLIPKLIQDSWILYHAILLPFSRLGLLRKWSLKTEKWPQLVQP